MSYSRSDIPLIPRSTVVNPYWWEKHRTKDAAKIENWSCISYEHGGFALPTPCTTYLQGNLYGRSGAPHEGYWSDETSTIVAVKGSTVETRNTVYTLGKMSPKYAAWLQQEEERQKKNFEFSPDGRRQQLLGNLRQGNRYKGRVIGLEANNYQVNLGYGLNGLLPVSEVNTTLNPKKKHEVWVWFATQDPDGTVRLTHRDPASNRGS